MVTKNFDSYKKMVVERYDQQKSAGILSSELIHAKPADLKAECLAKCDEGFDEKSERLLRSFFGQKEDLTAYRMAIKKAGTDKCKPLANFLKDRSIVTDEKNIELLAWLISYEPRPYAIWLKNFEGKADDTDQQSIDEKLTLTVKPKINEIPVTPPSMPWVKTAPILLLILLVIGAVFYTIRPKPPVQIVSSAIGPGRCMYWSGDAYKVIPCGEKHQDTPVITLDTFKLRHFRKITDWRTLSENSVKKVWYAKINGTVEIYTTNGFHPVDTSRRLLPLTHYMLKKYIHPN